MPSDNELISRVISRDDHHAFATLVKRYQSDIRNYLRRLTKFDHHLADDLAQETFIAVYKHLKSFLGKAQFRTWLYKVAYNAYLQYLRKQKIDTVSWDEQHDMAENTSSNDTQGLEKVLSQLPSEQRSVIYLSYFKELSHSEIGQVMELPLGTVKSHITRGKASLKALLKLEDSNYE